MVGFRITYTLSMHSHPPLSPRTPYPPPQAVGKASGARAGGRVGGIGIIGVEILSHSVQIIVTFTINGFHCFF